MEKCPNCNAEIVENFDICWKCNYSFIDGEVIENPISPSPIKIKCLRCEETMVNQGLIIFIKETE